MQTGPLIVLGILVAVALLVGLVRLAMRGGIKTHNTTIMLRGTPDEVLNDLRLSVATVRGHSTVRDTPNSLSIAFGVTPGWVPLVCIVFFPIGLLALLGRRTESSALIAEPIDQYRTRLRLSGRFDQRAIARINTVIELRS